MKAIRKSDGKIIDVEIHGFNHKNCPTSYHTNFKDFYKPEDLDFDVPEEPTFDWQSFRAEAAKDILCAIISRNPETYLANIDFVVDQSVIAAGKLIKSLNEKDKEEK